MIKLYFRYMFANRCLNKQLDDVMVRHVIEDFASAEVHKYLNVNAQ
jgi:hypothetical protein